MEMLSAGNARSVYACDAASAASPSAFACSCIEARRGLAAWRTFEDVLVEPVARSTAVAAATTMSPTTAIKRRRLIWIPLLSVLPGLSRELYLSGGTAKVKDPRVFAGPRRPR
jgi:hypothetical protein